MIFTWRSRNWGVWEEYFENAIPILCHAFPGMLLFDADTLILGHLLSEAWLHKFARR